MAMIMGTASLASVPSVQCCLGLFAIGFVFIGYYKFSTRYKELSSGILDESKSDFMDIYTPIAVACIITLATLIAIILAIQQWEQSRYE